MHLIWHIIRKDFSRDRWALLAWVGLILAQIALGVVLLGDDGVVRDRIEWIQIASAGLVLVQVLAGYLLVARLVLADPLLGTDVFWATRPLSRRRLLVAKAGAAGLFFVVVPLICLVPWWCACGFTANDVAWMAVEKIGWQLLFIAPAFLIASLTNEIGRVLLWSLVLFILVLVVFATVASSLAETRRVMESRSVFFSVQYGRNWLSALLFVLCSGGVAVHHYLTARHVRSIGLAGLSLGVIALPQILPPYDWSLALSRLPQRSLPAEFATLPDQLKIEVGDVMSTQRPGLREVRNETERTIVTEFYYQGLPPGLSVNIGRIQQLWRWPGNITIKRDGFDGLNDIRAVAFLRQTLGLAEPASDPETQAYLKQRQQVQQATRLADRTRLPPPPQWMVPSSRPGQRDLIYTSVPPSFLKRAAAEPPAYEASFEGVITRQFILADLPLRDGAKGGRDSVRVRLQRVIQEKPARVGALKDPPPAGPDEYGFMLLVTAPVLRVNGLWLVDLIVPNRLNPGNRGELCTVNPTTGEIISSNYFSLQATRRAIVAGVAFSWNNNRLRPGIVNRNGAFQFRDPDWLTHSRLVLVSSETIARFDRSLQLARQGSQPSLWLDHDPRADAAK